MSPARDSTWSGALRRLRPAGPAAAILAAWWLAYSAYFGGAARFGEVMPVSTDLTLHLLPLYSLREDGRVPLWNPFAGAGMALDGNPQFGASYPPHWIFPLLPDARRAIGLYLALHFLAAMGGTAGWLGALGLGPAARTAGAVVFGLGGYMAARTVNPVLLISSAWLPWIFWGTSARTPAGAALTAFGWAMAARAGSPQTLAHGMAGFAAVLALCGGGFPRARRLKLVYASLGLACGAPAIIPALAQAASSVRPAASAAENLRDSLRWGEIPGALFGGLGGAVHPEINDKCAVAGGGAWALILLAASRRAVWRDARWLGGTALFAAGLALALGDSIGWQFVMPWIPGLKWLAGPARALLISAAGLALLTALAVEAAPEFSRRRIAVLAGLALPAAALGIWAAAREWERLGGEDFLRVLGLNPRALPGAAFAFAVPPLEAFFAAALAGGFAFAGARFRGWLRPALAAMICVQLLRFAPRVGPDIEPCAAFEAPPQARAILRAGSQGREGPERREGEAPSAEAADPAAMINSGGAAPFRVAAADPLQIHDSAWDSESRDAFLMPNLGTLHGLEMISAFDPMLDRAFTEEAARSFGCAPHNDPLRHYDPAFANPEGLAGFNVRYWIGHPGDRRVTNQPVALTQQSPAAWTPLPEELGPLPAAEGWLFASLLDGESNLPPGTPAARLVVEAEEGEFAFPARCGIETGHIGDAPEARRPGAGGALVRTSWRAADPSAPGLERELRDYRGYIPFGRTLRIKRVRWELLRPGNVMFLPAQAVRLAGIAEDKAWRLVRDDPAAPVYEFLKARPRAEGPAGAAVEWLERGLSRFTVRLDSPEAGRLVARTAHSPGWRAEVNGRPAPVEQSGALWMAVAVPAGQAEVRFVYDPPLYRWMNRLGTAAAIAAAALAWIAGRRRRRRLGPAGSWSSFRIR